MISSLSAKFVQKSSPLASLKGPSISRVLCRNTEATSTIGGVPGWAMRFMRTSYVDVFVCSSPGTQPLYTTALDHSGSKRLLGSQFHPVLDKETENWYPFLVHKLTPERSGSSLVPSPYPAAMESWFKPAHHRAPAPLQVHPPSLIP